MVLGVVGHERTSLLVWILELRRAALSRRCQTGSHIALTAETATPAAGCQQEAAVVAVAADSGLRVRPWRWVACCSACAWSVDCTGTALDLGAEAHITVTIVYNKHILVVIMGKGKKAAHLWMMVGHPSSTGVGLVCDNHLQSGQTTLRRDAPLQYRSDSG